MHHQQKNATNMIKFFKQLFCIHTFEMTDEAKAIPPIELKEDESGIETREHQCLKCEKTRMLSHMIA